MFAARGRFAGDLPWDAATAFRERPCPFAVVQSSSGADPSALAAEVASELKIGPGGSGELRPQMLPFASIFTGGGSSQCANYESR